MTVTTSSYTCNNRRPYNLYCVGADVKQCSINQSTFICMTTDSNSFDTDRHYSNEVNAKNQTS